MAIRHLSKTHFDTADAVEMPAGTTAQRPGSPVAGMFRYNTDDNQFEGYTTEWGAIAGSGGGGSGTLEIEKNILTGNGSNTAFSTTSTIDSENNIQVYISGVYQSKDNFSTSGSTVTFTTAPPNGASVEIIHFKSVVGRVQVDTFTGDASDTTFDLSTAINSENNTQVFIDGAYQSKNSYSTSAATITFSAAPPDGSVIEVVHVIPDSEGGIEWDAAVKTSSFTALANYGYFVDTTSSAVTVTLPSSPGVGNIVSVIDCAGNAATNKITITSSDDIENQSEDRHINYNKGAVELVYSGSARGWLVASAANETASALAGIPDLEVDFLVVAGGGGGGAGLNVSTIGNGGGGGAGGLRTSYGSTSGGGSNAEDTLSLTVSTNYTVTVGEGGTGADAPSSGTGTNPTKGQDSVFSTITSIGGGHGHSYLGSSAGVNGGSGGGDAYSGKTPGTGTANQGYAGGDSYDSGYDYNGGGGGGASQAGANATAAKGGDGGDGLAVSITGSSVTYAGGGGGSNGNNQNTSSDVGAGGAGGGGVGAGGNNPGGNGSANTGGGGGAGGNNGVSGSAVPAADGGDGGSGVVILRYPQEYFIHSPSTLTSTTTIVGTDKVTTFTSGTGNITFETTQDPNRFDINYLVVAGGGSGGSNSAGGGGAGGLRTSYGSTSGGGVSAESSLSLVASANYTVTVGAGAAAVSYNNDGLQGSNSTFSIVTSIGGGGGHRYDLNETSGGSGGGGNSTTGGSGTPGQGFNGGINSSDNVSYTTGGGGGGASAVGGNASSSSGGNGGAGLSVSITGSAATYAGGGGGAGDSRSSRAGGTGGSGGGGNGGYNGANGLSAGSSNTGGGGGGNGYSSGSSAAGGSGVVILRYPNTRTISIGAGLTGTTATDGTDKVTTFTAGTGTISFT